MSVQWVRRSSTRCGPASAQVRSGSTPSITSTAVNCPNTKMVLSGFSQGAAVMGFVTANAVPDGVSAADVPAPLPPEVADHIAAVALFGKPSTRFMRVLRDPPVTIGPQHADKSIDLCVDNDLVCDAHGSSFSAYDTYEDSGMVGQGAAFVANLLQTSWAAAEAAAAASQSPQSPSEHLPSDGTILPGPPAPVVPVEPAGPIT